MGQWWLLTWDLFAGVTSKLLLFRLASYGDALQCLPATPTQPGTQNTLMPSSSMVSLAEWVPETLPGLLGGLGRSLVVIVQDLGMS